MSSENKVSYSLDTTDLENGLNEFGIKVQSAIEMYAETAAKDCESYAKKNRPWTDRTSRARQGLRGYTERKNIGSVDVCVAHSVDYGIYLEYAHEKKYAILWPTIQTKANDILKGFRNMIALIKVR